MAAPELQLVEAGGATIWRVGRAPDPWAWIDPRYAGNARWDDPDVAFRTTYQISSRIVDTDDVNLIQAMELHGLTWRDS